ncbi:MAG: protease complex subunit PrcB family protein [Proteobacteria bacterium]|nr:protease complex subunit PrcB family protein [Pseudomonadota bacterium]
MRKMTWRVFLTICLSVVFASCSEPGTSQQVLPGAAGPGRENLDEAMEWQGQRSRVVDETSIVAATQAEWEGLWRRVGREPPVALPDETVAVGIFLGMRRTAGYLIEIVSAVESGGAFAVVYAERKPTGPALMVLTYPYLIRLFPDSKRPVKVEKHR